ncbi:cation exporting V-type ATPase, subunit B [Alteracholeplasma palmae J233]|uniref:V-type ATP synthase beta chain n=1 Tax=Alteracholeplasma palmae (strain ATCC 49389 / J233) TaxID=1318466 RepID=U4KP72_ALTPJ|nr:V-type ATP synthase subunit B [Alteracholeplasma palmae]CCV64010.1 cation exporting V-type ATPase, subunit B [Alteracholeplasma palmae J233]
MKYQYIGLDEINGPLIFLENVKDASFEEVVTIELKNGETKKGRVIQIDGNKVAIQVFEGTTGMSLTETKTTFTGEPMKISLSKEILGRVFNGSGEPLDGLGNVFSEKRFDINGSALNPVSRVYPRNYIHTGISSIDTLTTLIRGQKLPIFSGSGLSHNELAVQIVKQAKLSDDSNEEFCIVFAAMGVKHDVANYFRQAFEEANVMSKVVMYVNVANDPIIERILTPRAALTAAEYLAYEKDMHVLVILTDMTAYCEALREFSSSKGEIPGRKGYPGYLYSDLSSLYERAGIIKQAKGSVTQIPILTMPNDDITHPVPDLTGYITEGQIVLSKELHQMGIYPPVNILPSLSRLMKDGIGAKYTRADHQDLANQLFASYARVLEAKSLASVIGEDELNDIDRAYLLYGKYFDEYFLSQGNENRTMEETLNLGWDLLSVLPVSELNRLDQKVINQFYNPESAQKRFKITHNDIASSIINKGNNNE